MKVPDKLFIKPGQIKVEMIPGGELPNVGIQYLRKDALLEYLNGLDTNSNYGRFVIDNLIEHIESL